MAFPTFRIIAAGLALSGLAYTNTVQVPISGRTVPSGKTGKPIAKPVEAKPVEKPAAKSSVAKPIDKPAVPATKPPVVSVKRDTIPPPLRDLGQKALKAPERLVFDVIWGGWSFRWVHAGEATLELLPTADPHQWKIQSLARCNHFFETFYPVRDTVSSLIDARGVYPLRFEKHLHEGSYHADIKAIYNQTTHTLQTQDTVLDIEPFTQDVLSAFYFIRTQKIDAGDTLDLAAVSGKKKYNLKVLCHGREDVEVPAGKFHTLVVEPVLKGDELFKAKGKLTIWVTDDEAHVPVKMESKIPVGSIKAELISKSWPSP